MGYVYMKDIAHLNAPISPETNIYWQGAETLVAVKPQELHDLFASLQTPLHLLKNGSRLGAAAGGMLVSAENGQPSGWKWLQTIPALPAEQLGDPAFKAHYGVRYACMAGSMAHGISSEEMVIQMGKAGYLASYGAGGIPPERLEQAILHIQGALPQGAPYAFNLIFNPNEPALERKAVDLYLKHGVSTIEASAFLDITLPLVLYRTAGLMQSADGHIQARNRVIAKLSRKEVAARFMSPAPQDILNQLLAEGRISVDQARWAQSVPLADDITVEADSGGHTDNRPLVCLMPSMLALRDEMQQKHAYPTPLRIGAAGGIGTPAAALAAFTLGAAYIVTGSINQSCTEAGASPHTRKLLAQADMADVSMAPAGDMFEMGVRVQVLKRGSMFPMRAQKLYELYKDYASIEEIPQEERQRIEKQIFKKNLDEIWQDTAAFFRQRDPAQLQRATDDPRHKMALIFRWYLGLSSHWSNHGEKDREMDYQIWCGPAIGAFNDWVKGTPLAEPQNRRVVAVSDAIMQSAAFLARLQIARLGGFHLPVANTN